MRSAGAAVFDAVLRYSFASVLVGDHVFTKAIMAGPDGRIVAVAETALDHHVAIACFFP
jgi:hypothetical protein